MFIIRLFAGLLSLIFNCLRFLMKGLKYLLGYGGCLIVLGAIVMLCIQGFEVIRDAAIFFVSGIVVGLVGLVCIPLEDKFDDISTDLAIFFYGPSSDTHSTSSSSHHSTSDYTSSYTDSYTDSSISYDHRYHDELDAVQHAISISETYGEDWRGYDPEAPGPDPDTFVNIDL